MAANLTQLNNYFTNTLLIGDPALRGALNNQGLGSFEDFATLTEKDVEKICANVRKPGGWIANPDVALPNQPPTIPNPGVTCGRVLEQRLQMLRYYVFHLTRIQRMPVVPANATLAIITTVYKLKDHDKSEENLDPPAPALHKVDQARVVLEHLDEYLLRKRGEQGCPLAYVVRETPALPAVDPGFGLPTYDAEMIARAPHTGIHYPADNATVWAAIRQLTRGGPAWNWVSRYSTTANGRQAYLAIKLHYLGDSHQTRTHTSADAILLKSATYNKGNRNMTFERFCGQLNNGYGFADIEEATGEPVAEARKDRVFLRGLNDPGLATATAAQIVGNTTVNDTSEHAVNYTAPSVDMQNSLLNSQRESQNVSNTSTDRRGLCWFIVMMLVLYLLIIRQMDA